MTNLGFQSAYHLFNEIPECVCERAFLPGKPELAEHVRTETPLFSYESLTPVREFDVIAFSIPFEEDYINIPRLLELAGVAQRAKDRGEGAPLVMAGGVAVSLNPEPLAELIDTFIIGEGEGAIGGLAGILNTERKKGAGKKEILKALDLVRCAYVPSFYEFLYDGPRVKGITPLEGAKKRIRAEKNFDLERFELPQTFVHTPESEFRGAHLVEVERGCGRNCRFCAAGYLYLPPRWRDFDKVKGSVKKGIETSKKVGLVGTAVSEYPHIKETVKAGIALKGEVTLSSLRLDKLDSEFLGLLHEAGYKTVTLAPEAGTARMRDIINKGITGDEIIEAARLIGLAGFLKLKLYFMVGLPAETDEDAGEIAGLALEIKEAMKRGEMTLSINPFIPKPFTPFQWHPFEDPEVIDRRLSIIKKRLSKTKGIEVNALGAKEALIQAYLSRADRRAGEFIIMASREGWRKAHKATEGLIEESIRMDRSKEEVFPWELIDHRLRRSYLWREYQKALEGRTTPPCDVGNCSRCGVC